MTFILNNHKSNKTFMDMAMAWEEKFLDFVQHYESDNLNLYFHAEVCSKDAISVVQYPLYFALM